MFKKAERKQARLRLALTGPSGAGKTYSALLIAKGLGGSIAVIDTEHGSASLYSDLADFDVCELEAPYEPERYIAAIQEAEKAGYDTLIIDSITHEWNGKGGILELVENKTKTSKSRNSYTAWNDITPRHQRFVETILASRMNIIVTMRSKAEYALEKNEKGQMVPRKLTMAPQQRDGIEYEFTTVLDLTVENHLAEASKDRMGLFTQPFVIAEDTSKKILDWLAMGKELPAHEQANKDNQHAETLTKLGNVLLAKNNGDKSAIYKEASNFFNREISTLKQLSLEEALEMLEALEAA